MTLSYAIELPFSALTVSDLYIFSDATIDGDRQVVIIEVPAS